MPSAFPGRGPCSIASAIMSRARRSPAGSPEPGADVEVIAVGADILDRLGVLKDTELLLNSLGDPESRAAHRKVLIDYFKSHEGKLSEDSKSRLERNPLRIFDSKDEGDRSLLPNAPLL